jgi:hypothetical protein
MPILAELGFSHGLKLNQKKYKTMAALGSRPIIFVFKAQIYVSQAFMMARQTPC